jgi:hypothetical protein
MQETGGGAARGVAGNEKGGWGTPHTTQIPMKFQNECPLLGQLIVAGKRGLIGED